uniref:Uncharacterized protein n=1 Tax=Anas platyrhynchos platyrhynchos TaxID=8840 RepID=A0A493TA46_ANAPP
LAALQLGKCLAAFAEHLKLHTGTYTYLMCCGVSFRNPAGRTGLTGRGLLGRWGPNHAADPIVTR